MYRWEPAYYAVCYLYREKPAAADEPVNQLLEKATAREESEDTDKPPTGPNCWKKSATTATMSSSWT